MIKSVSIKNFLGYGAFKHTSGFAGVNLFIGKNDSGKTGLLKLLYAACKSVEIFSLKSASEEVNYKRILADKLSDTFQPGKKGIGELVNKITRKKLSAEIELNYERWNYHERINFSFGETTINTINDGTESINLISQDFRCLFIPSKEVLTSLKAIRATRDNLHIPGFDDTYLDLIRALVIPTQKGRVADDFVKINDSLESLFNGHIVQGQEDDFVFKKGNMEYQMQLTADGIKKIGILTTLIRNRQLNQSSILFIDEPENTLHPEAAREIVQIIMLMAKSGVQVFVTSHSFFILKEFSLLARKWDTSVNCFMLSKDETGLINFTVADLKEGLPENEISEEALKMADSEITLDLGL